jgi:hypothetical protein
LPAFGAPESRALIPIFESAVAKVKQSLSSSRNTSNTFDIFLPLPLQLSTILRDLIATSDSGSVTVDMPSWLTRATLDALGEGVLVLSLLFYLPISLIYSCVRL